MAQQKFISKLLEHPDKEEIINKLILDIPVSDIVEWLKIKYEEADGKLILSQKSLQIFKDNHLDIYSAIKDDFLKTKNAIINNDIENVELLIKGNSTYKDLVVKTVGQELDLKQSIKQLCNVVETRLSQIFDRVQEDPRDVGKVDRVLIEYVREFGSLLEKAYKIVNNGPDQVIQHNITVQHIDQHINIFYEVIKKVLQKMDIESSMYFMELFNQEMAKIKDPNNKVIQPVEERLAEVKALNSHIGEALINEQ